MYYHKITVTIVIGILLFSISASSFSEEKRLDYYKKPRSLMAEIFKRGAIKIVNELYSSNTAWESVLNNIAKGDVFWLRVAVALHAGTDAGTSEMLTLALGEALERDPENVFYLTLNSFELESVCSGPDVDDTHYNSYELSMAAIKRRQARLSTISKRNIKNIATKCVGYLEKSKEGISQFYEQK